LGGRKPIGDRAMTSAERSRRSRARKRELAGLPPTNGKRGGGRCLFGRPLTAAERWQRYKVGASYRAALQRRVLARRAVLKAWEGRCEQGNRDDDGNGRAGD
jgi:hypothetical protein